VVAAAQRRRKEHPDEVHQIAVPLAGLAAAFVFAVLAVLFVVTFEIVFMLFLAPPRH
jgi:hypothetical protein